MAETYLTKSYIQTREAGKKLAKKILNERLKGHATVLGLKGNLGGGKTTFLQGFAKGLGIKGKILSPTFVIIKTFRIPSRRFDRFYHIDCYRIKKKADLSRLGFKDIVSNPRNIIAIEWADRLKSAMPKAATWIMFDFIDEKTRMITIKSGE